jgi:LysR family transcriptional regulator, glycine cleavage system transcriptional activator
MKRTHLPLNALRVFDAAARHLSFTKAADELAVTPAAVGQQIRSLEDLLGVVLFVRGPRALELTPEAERSLPALREGFARFEDSVREMQAGQGSHALTISAPPSFAAKWLVPRLGAFAEANPHMQLRLLVSADLVDFSQANVDLALRYGDGRYPEVHVELLMPEQVVPICAPTVLTGDIPLRDPADLAGHVLIHDESSLDDDQAPTWPMWLKAAGVEHPHADRGLAFNQSALVIEAALAGRGIALAKQRLAQADLDAGRLVQPFAAATQAGFAYWIVAPEAQWRQAKVKQFVTWLRTQVQD